MGSAAAGGALGVSADYNLEWGKFDFSYAEYIIATLTLTNALAASGDKLDAYVQASHGRHFGTADGAIWGDRIAFLEVLGNITTPTVTAPYQQKASLSCISDDLGSGQVVYVVSGGDTGSHLAAGQVISGPMPAPERDSQAIVNGGVPRSNVRMALRVTDAGALASRFVGFIDLWAWVRFD